MPTRWILASALVLGLPLTASAASKLEIQRSLIAAANEHGVPVSLALAVAKVESGFDATALSHKGARGVMQIMPSTAQGEFMVSADRLWDANLNSRLGVEYLKRLYDNYGRWDLALSHYNGGTVKGDTPTSYTVDYVNSVLAWQRHYSSKGCDRLTAKRISTHADSVAICLDGSATATAALAPAPSSQKMAVLEQTRTLPAPNIAPPFSTEKLTVTLTTPSKALPEPAAAEPGMPTAAPRPTVQASPLGDKATRASEVKVDQPAISAPRTAAPAQAASPPGSGYPARVATTTQPVARPQRVAVQTAANQAQATREPSAACDVIVDHPAISAPRTAAPAQAASPPGSDYPARVATQPVAQPQRVAVADTYYIPAPPPAPVWPVYSTPYRRLPPQRFGYGGPGFGRWQARPVPWR